MKSLCIIVAVVAYAALVQAETTTQSPFDKTISVAVNNIEDGIKKFNEVTGLKTEFDKTKVQSFLTNGLGENKKKIDELLKNLEEKSKPFNDDLKKNIEALSKQFAESVKAFNNTDTQGNIQKLKELFEKSFKTVVEQANNVAKSAGVTPSPEIQKHINELAEEVGKGAKIVQDKLQDVINEAQKNKSS